MGSTSVTTVRFFRPSPVRLEDGVTGLSRKLVDSVDTLYASACPVCLSDQDDFDGLKIDTERLLWDVYHDNLEDGVHKITARAVAQKLWEAVEQGYGKNPVDMDWDSPDRKMLEALSKNVYQFAGVKNWTMNQALTDLIVQDDKVVGYGRFRAMAAPILRKFHDQQLRTEYNHAVAQSQMSSKWVDIQANQGALPNLRYLTVGDQRVRASHAELDQILKPVDDPFWNTYYPPNGWNCRCTVIQESGGKVDKKEYPDDGIADPLFNKNWGKEGVVFPKSHPYFLAASSAALTSLSSDDLSSVSFDLHKRFDSGGAVWISRLVDKNSTDYADLLKISLHQAENGDSVFINPRLNKNDLRWKYFFDGHEFEWKCPDLKINGEFWELKETLAPWNLKRKMSNMCKSANGQCRNVIFKIPKGESPTKCNKRVNEFMRQAGNVFQKWQYWDGSQFVKKETGG